MCSTETIAKGIRILAVRGPLTRQRALASGVECPPLYGDPALLLPLLLPPPTHRRGVALVPHFSDAARLRGRWSSGEVALIDPQGPLESVVARIAASELVISSSLHGVIVAHAYGVPAVWIELRPLPSGDRTKFHDHQLSQELEPRPPVLVGDGRRVSDWLDVDGLARWAQLPTQVNVAPLLQACPFIPRPQQ